MHTVNVHESNHIHTSTSVLKNVVYKEMRMYLNHFHFKEYSIEWEQNILNLLPKKYRIKYSSFLEFMFKEVKDIYVKDMHNFLSEYTLLHASTSKNCSSVSTHSNYNFLNEKETCYHTMFLRHRKLLEKRYLLFLNPIKTIINVAQTKLPTIICNFEHYHQLGLISLIDLQNIATNDIKKVSAKISNYFYGIVSKTISESKQLRNIHRKRLQSIMRCVTHIFVQQILNIMIKSTEHMLNILHDKHYCPQIKFQLVLQNGDLILSPSAEQIFIVYHSIIEKLSLIGQDLMPLENWLNIKTCSKYIKISLPDWYIEESNNRLKALLNSLFHSVNNHVASISAEFYPICAPSLREEIVSLTEGPIDTDLFLKNIQNYKIYLVKANEMFSSTYHIVGKLEQYEAAKALRRESSNIIAAFTKKLIQYHLDLNTFICTEFEHLKTKALNIPRDPKSLIELCDYISHASQELIYELGNKIKRSIHIIIILSEITILSEDHIQLNVRTINWLYEIDPIIKQSHVLSEAMKNELEDDMQRRINNLNVEVDNIGPQLSVLNDMDSINNIEEYVEYYKGLLKQANRIFREMQAINEEENLFKFPETEFPNVIEVYDIITSFYDLIRTIHQWQKDHSIWLDGPFEWLDAVVIERRTLMYFEIITEMSKTFRVRIKMDASANKCFKYTGIADDPDPLQQPAPLKLCWQVLKNINEFKKYLPLVMCMCSPALQKRHWIEMSAICDFDLTPNAGTSLRKIIAFNLMGDIEKYQAITVGANRELELELRLLKMTEEWDDISFEIDCDFTTGTYVFSKLENIESLLEDHLTNIEEMRTSSFVTHISSALIDFFTSLIRIQEIIYQWNYIQTLMYALNSIFYYPSIEVHLSPELHSYEEIKTVLNNIRNKLLKDPRFRTINDVQILESLNATAVKLECLNQKVKCYMDSKKLSFPRFYFLSDKEIQEILFESQNLDKLHFLVQKCFEGVQRIKINEDKCICSIIGDYGEEVDLERPIPFCIQYDHEEEWLIHIEREIYATIKNNILQCSQIFSNTFLCHSIIHFPSMVIVCAFQLYWTAEVHNCLTPYNYQALNKLYSKYISYLDNLIIELKKFSRLRNLLTTVITVVIQQKDIIKLLLGKNITKTTDFEWVAQVQHYIEDENVKVSIFQTGVIYGYEYGYYKQEIINTPLTERCYHTLMQAYKYHFYGAVTGPPATGKTETIKSLVKIIASQFRVFNCSSISSYNLLSQICKGFISCPVWLCFEKLDVLQTDLTARVTQSLTSISQALATDLNVVMFEGVSLKMNPVGQICVIMELGLYKYSKLPDNLKRLFRSVSMLTPDMNRVAEVELFAGSISNSKLLSSKLITFHKILSQQLWCESCNNFNSHSVKAVIRTVIYLKRNFPEESETALLLRALIDNILPKLCKIDTHIFENIIQDMFPNVLLLPPNYTTFLESLEAVCKSKNIYIYDILKLKIIQLFELMYIHQSLIIVGNPLVGKTEILNLLQAVFLDLHGRGIEFGATVELETIVPGSMDANQLFGHFDEKTNLWRNGVCSKAFRSFSESNTFSKRWIIFDVALDNSWIENLYTVLDKNNFLQLTSGEKINIAESISIFFEMMNLTNVSPAIVSQCGIIYIESNSIDWKSYAKSHFAKHNIYNGHEEILYQLFVWAIHPCLLFVQKHCAPSFDVGQLHYIMSTLNVFEMYIEDAVAENAEDKGKANHFLVWVQIALVLAVIWGIGGNLDIDSHTKFNSFCMSLWSGKNLEHPKPAVIKSVDITLPHEGLIQDHFYTFKGIGNWKYWGSADILKNEQILEIPSNEIFVPTINTMKYNHILLKHIKHRKPFILCGEVSVGKTFIIKNFLRTKLSEGINSNCFSFISLCTARMMQKSLLSKLNKINRTHYNPPGDKLCVNFIDDLNMQRYDCSIEVNTILELLRQYYNCSFIYDINEPQKVFIHDVMFLLSITGSIITKICPRFLRHFHLYTVYSPSIDTMSRIFSNVLFYNFKRNSFNADVLPAVTNISSATFDIYISILKKLRPIPAKFLYQFNMKDIAKVISGCSLLQKESVETKVTFTRLWAHEIWRVFADRISDDNDKEWLFLQMGDTCKRYFKDSIETVFDYLPRNERNEITMNSFNDSLMFINVMNAQNDNMKRYEVVNSVEKLKNKIVFYITEYNNTNTKNHIDIVVTQFVLQCVIKISRVLAIPKESLLMISTVNTGRKSLARLAAYMQGQELFEPSVHSYYDFKMWRKDLKTILQECGGTNKNITLLLKDKQGRNNFLHDVICFLTIGEIPNLFSVEEKCNIIEMVRLNAQGGNRNMEISNSAVMSYFHDQCKDKLHVIICFNTTNKTLRSYMHKYPELVKCCTINWYEIWPTNTLTQIGLKYMHDVNVKENIKENIVKTCIKFHDTVHEESSRYLKETGHKIHVTLSAFLHMMELYIDLVSKKQKDILTMRNKYLVGLEKLESANQQIKKMKASLTMLRPQLESAVEKSAATMKQVEIENSSIEKATIIVQREEKIANKKAEIAGKLKAECEADLAVAIPILEDAIAALNTLKPTDITLVKAMKNPPDTVKLVMAAICVMLDIPPDKTIDSVSGKKYTDYWTPSKRILSDMNFLQTLKDYDKNNISSHITQVIKKTYMADNNFKPHIVAKASSAAEGLCKWVYAMVSYDEVAKAVAPKKEKLLIAQEECDEAEAFLREKRKKLSELHAKLATLNNSLQESLQEKLKLENAVQDCTNKLHTAENLMASLKEEKDRWVQCEDTLKKSNCNLIGDMTLTCGIISYLAPYNTTFRNQIMEYWKHYLEDAKIPYSLHYNLINILGEENDINEWYFAGLPKSNFTVENIFIMRSSKLWSLFIDPQNQANQWIKAIERKNKLKVIKLTDADYISIMQYNVENGIPTLIENVGEKLEILLDPYLLKQICILNGNSYLNTECDVIKYSYDFRLYITTRLHSPQFSCVLFSMVTVINFSIPNEALQDRLLNFIMSKEKPELQEKLEALLIEDANSKNILKQQEEIVLNILSSNTINILEDESALSALNSSKSLTFNIVKKQNSGWKMSLEIDQFRNDYLQFVQYCVDLFNGLSALSQLNYMYSFSFSWYMEVYKKAIETSNRSTVLARRLKYLKSSFTHNLHSSVCRSLAAEDEILYSFLLCSKILLQNQQTTKAELTYFMAPNLDCVTEIPSCISKWLPSNTWMNICSLSKVLPAFSELPNNICCNDKAWEQYYSSDELEDYLMPEPWSNKLSMFQKLILVKVLHPAKIIKRVNQMIETILGKTQDCSSKLKICESYEESNCLTPLLFVLPSAVDPLSLVSECAKIKHCFSKFVSLSMAYGQEKQAELLIQRAQSSGSWVFIQNCHLVPHWMIQLEKLCENCNASNVSLNFRLWLSSLPIKEFPISILQNSIKIIYDCPVNIKDALLNIYHSVPIANKDFRDFKSCPGKDEMFSKLLFGLCLFHAIIQEKKTFGILGWDIPYEVDHSDLEISIMQLQNFTDNYSCKYPENVSFNILTYLIGECNYGREVENEFCSRYIKCLFKDYCSANIIACQTSTSRIQKLIPPRYEYYDTIKHIETCFSNLSPESLGSNKSYITNKNATLATNFVSSLSSLTSPNVISDEQLLEDEILILIDNINDNLCNSMKLNEIQGESTSMLEEPLQRVRLCEIKSLKRTLKTISKTLADLKSALSGSLVLSSDLQELASEIYKHKVPDTWTKMHDYVVSTNLPNYIDNLIKRTNFVNNWIIKSPSNIVQLDALHHCEMFFSAILLTFSKNYSVPVEEIKLDFEVGTRESVDTDRIDTYFINGLKLCGARWDFDKNMLVENFTNETWQEMPSISVTYSWNQKRTGEIYDCPVYITATQQVSKNIKYPSNHIFNIPLNAVAPQTYWIKSGAALFCHVP